MTSNFTLIHCDQRTPEWAAARSGRVTASVAKDVLAFNKDGKESAARRDLRTRLVLERLTGQPQGDSYTSPDMLAGIEREPLAREAYIQKTGHEVLQVGFLAHNELMCGASPDGIVATGDGAVDLVLEIKAPKDATHLRYLLSDGGIPTEHLAQLRHLAFVTGCRCIDFVSYNPHFPEKGQLYMVSICREELNLEDYEKQLRTFLTEVDEAERLLRERLEEAA